jgi:membrane protease YdiL (CAAX protease family)
MAGASDPEAATSGDEPHARVSVPVEVVLAFGFAIGVAALLYHAQGVPFIHENLHALVAAVFLVLPQVLLRQRGNIERYGFTLARWRFGAAVAALAIALVLPLYTGGFIAYNRFLCGHRPSLVIGSCWRMMHPILRFPPDFGMQIVAQLVVVALPEELFFRGYVQGRLEDAWVPQTRLGGARVGAAWIVGALLFALGHYLVTFDPLMLTRFFPGLVFGWMYARTRSILAGTLFHAACNLLMDVLIPTFLA